MTKDLTKKDPEAISWDEFFMGVALVAAKRSKDPSTKVGACIINRDKRIIGVGYNGFPMGCNDDEFPWQRDGEKLDTKYPYVVHAELNAIHNRNTESAKGASLYCTLFPCNECAKSIIQVGIERIIFLDDKYHDTDEAEAARRMFDASGKIYKKYEGKLKGIELRQ